jgi:hypothetical protein
MPHSDYAPTIHDCGELQRAIDGHIVIAGDSQPHVHIRSATVDVAFMFFQLRPAGA